MNFKKCLIVLDVSIMYLVHELLILCLVGLWLIWQFFKFQNIWDIIESLTPYILDTKLSLMSNRFVNFKKGWIRKRSIYEDNLVDHKFGWCERISLKKFLQQHSLDIVLIQELKRSKVDKTNWLNQYGIPKILKWCWLGFWGSKA